MFSAIIPTTPPIVAVQVPTWPEIDQAREDLLGELERFFMTPVVLVNWDDAGRFRCVGYECRESLLTDEDLTWREFDLLPAPEIPF